MDDLKLFIPIAKVDAAKRLVYGVVTAEVEDSIGEICDYASTKPFYENWSSDFARVTGGKSLGNLRSMHHAGVASGKLTAIEYNDDTKQIEICAKVVDDAEWLKVETGVYTGFSQGGRYVQRWIDQAGKSRYTADPSEVSLVDKPCLFEAAFAVVKADSSLELRKFKPRETFENFDQISIAPQKPRTLTDIVGELRAILEDIPDDLPKLLKSTFAAPASATSGLQDYDIEGEGHRRDSAARRRQRRRRKRQALDGVRKFFTERSDKCQKLLAELRESLAEIAAQPLQMGTSSVSKNFHIDGAQPDVFDAGKLADELERRNREA